MAGDEAGRRARKGKDYIIFISPGGLRIDLVLRPLHSGWRYFPARDAGITSFHGVAIQVGSQLHTWGTKCPASCDTSVQTPRPPVMSDGLRPPGQLVPRHGSTQKQ